MPEYLSPGVYVEEVENGPVPIEGVSTSTTGAVGVTARGPASGKPVLVTSFGEFVRTFGGFLDTPSDAVVNHWGSSANPEGGNWWQFPLSVKGFFDNGGQRLYVKRVVSSTAASAAGSFGKGLVAELDRDSPDGKVIKLKHLIGIGQTLNGAAVSVTVYRDQTQLGAASAIAAYDPDTREITLANPVGPLKASTDYIEIDARSKFDPNAGTIPAAEETLKFNARSPGQWGNALQVQVRPTVGATLRLNFSAALGDTPASTSVASTSYPPPVITISVADPTKFKKDDHVVINGIEYVIKTDPAAQPFTIAPASGAYIPDPKIAVGAVVTSTAILNPQSSTVSVASTYQTQPWLINVADATGFAAGNHVVIADTDYVIQANPAPTATSFAILPFSSANAVGINFPAGTVVRKLRRAGAAINTFSVAGADQLYADALVEFDNGQDKEIVSVDTISGTTVKFSAPLAKTYWEGDKIRVIEAQVTVENDGGAETFSGLPLTNNGVDLAAIVNTRSKLVEVQIGAGFSSADITKFPTLPLGEPAGFNHDWLVLANGDDGLSGLKPDDFVGQDGGSGKRTGIAALEDIEDIAICTVPGMWSESVHSALIDHCETLRYRFAILDPPDGLSIEDIRTFREPYDTKYAALYYPWIRVRDPGPGAPVDLAPSLHMAGIYARVDNDRGVHKAPGNEVIAGIELVEGLAQDVTRREQDQLNPNGINALRFFPDRGYRVWGARTLSSDGSWKYINVRRLFIFLEHSLDKGTQWVVFEPNDEPLWARVRASITNFLTSVWHSGALQGTQPSEAFFVKVDLTTMTQDDLDNGRLIILVGVAPVKPAEFVIIRIQQKTLEQTGP